jgi:hypothetical protein
MRLKAFKKIFLPAVFLAAFVLPLGFAAKVGAVPPKSECNGTSNPQKCKKDYEDCKNDGCRENVIKEAKKNTHIGIGGNGAGGKTDDGYQCGNLPDDNDNVKTKFNFGCLGASGPAGLGPIQDLVFALIRFASIGVGIAVTIALIMAGIQYTTAEGNPESSQKAKLRAQQALIGLGVYVFAFSILQFLIPGGIFK